MRHFATPRFWQCYRALPKSIRNQADQSYALLKSNPSHRSLHFKRVGRYRSSRVGLHYRALAVEVGDDCIWFWIGSHAEYDRLVGRTASGKAPLPTRPVQRKSRARKQPSSRRRR